MNVISVFSRKGGQGKSPLSFAIVKANPQYYYLTNDEDGASLYIELLKGKGALINDKKTLNIDFNGNLDLVYDAGGYTSETTLKMLENSNTIVIPSKMDTRPLASTHKLLKEIKNNPKINGKIILVITQWETNKYSDNSKFIINKMFEKLVSNIVFIRKTKIFDKIEAKNCSIQEFYENNPMYKKNKFFEEWDEFIKLI